MAEGAVDDGGDECDAEKRELVSRLKVLLLHLLKWRFQPTLRGTSWRLTVKERRCDVADHLGDNPSLTATVPEFIRAAYRLACIIASRETGRADVPRRLPLVFRAGDGGRFLA